jgi:hypothetical protein
MTIANLFILNMARQGVSCGRGADFDWRRHYFAGDEHHLWYVAFPLRCDLGILLDGGLTWMKAGWLVLSLDTSV